MSRKTRRKRLNGKYISVTVHPHAKRKVKRAARRAARTAKPLSLGFIIGGLVVGGFILIKMMPSTASNALPANVAPEPPMPS